MKRVPFLLVACAVLLTTSCGGATTTQEKPPEQPAEKKEHPIVVIETSKGTMKAELFINDSPITVKNFLAYVDKKYFDGTVFHRVMEDFMIQGGEFLPGVEKATNFQEFSAKKKGKTMPAIKNEAGNGLSNKRGTLAMARTPDPDSATAQFFINVVENGFRLDRSPARGAGYAVFGKVIEGMDVADKIRKVKTKRLFADIENVPVEPVIIKSIRRVEKKPE